MNERSAKFEVSVSKLSFVTYRNVLEREVNHQAMVLFMMLREFVVMIKDAEWIIYSFYMSTPPKLAFSNRENIGCVG